MRRATGGIDKSIIQLFYRYVISLNIFEKIASHPDYEEDQDDGISVSLLPTSKIDPMNNDGYVIVGSEADFMSITHFYYIYEDGKFREATKDETEYFDSQVGDIDTFKFLDDYPTMTTYDYWENRERTLNAVKKINESVNSESFEEWLSMKLQRKIGGKVGRGSEGSVYDFGDNNNKVIKISNVDIIQLYNLLNKNIKGVAKIYHIGYIVPPQRFRNSKGTHVELSGSKKIKDFKDFNKVGQEIHIRDNKIGYVIMEKVDTDVIYEIQTIRNILYKGFFKNGDITNTLGNLSILKDPLLEMNTFLHLFTYVKTGYDLLIHYLQKFDLPELVYEIIEVFKSVSKIYPKWTDIHSGQFGRNRKGELVVFDIGNDNEKLFGVDIHKYYPTPKNIIKESNGLSEVSTDIKKAFIELIGEEYYFNVNNQSYYNGKIDDDEYTSDLSLVLMDLFGYKYYVRSYVASGDLGSGPIEARQYYFYDENVKKFINGETIKLDNHDHGYGSEYLNEVLFEMEISDDLEHRYEVIEKFTYEDWVRNYESTENAVKNINESNSNLTINTIPTDVKKAYLEFIQNNKRFLEENDFALENEKRNGQVCEFFDTKIYLLDLHTEYFDPSDEISKVTHGYDYLLKLKWENTCDMGAKYYLYQENDKGFLDLSYNKIVEDIENVDGDRLDMIEQCFDVISQYSYKDWKENRDRTLSAVKNINEGYDQIGLNNIPTDVRNAFISHLTEDDRFIDRNIQTFIDKVQHYETESYYSEKWLLDVSSAPFRSDYIVRTIINDTAYRATYFHIYNDNLNKFTEPLPHEEHELSMWEIENGDTQDHFPIVHSYSCEDWERNYNRTHSAVKNINEDFHDYGDSVIPPDVKKAFIKYILSDEEFEGWNQDYLDRNESEEEMPLFNTLISLFDISHEDYEIEIDSKSDIKYIIKIYLSTETELNRYFMAYDDQKKEFVSIIDNDGYDNMIEDDSQFCTMEECVPTMMSYDYYDWKKNRDKTLGAVRNINENRHDLFKYDIPSGVQKAFLSYIGNNKYFNKNNLEDYQWRENTMRVSDPDFTDEDREGFMSEIYLLNTHGEKDLLGYDYLIMYYYFMENDNYREYYVYDESSKKFIDAGDIDYDKDKSLYNHLNTLNFVEFIEDRYESLAYYDYDKWKINHEKTFKSIVKIHEEIDIFGVDSNRKRPTSLKDIPIKIKKAYIEFIQKEMSQQDGWQEANAWIEADTTNNIIYLIDSVDIYLGDHIGFDQYDFLIKSTFFDGDDLVTMYYVYDEKKNEFIDTQDIRHKHIPHISSGDAWSRYRKHDRFLKLELNGLINRYSYSDWIKNRENTLNMVRNINENKINEIPNDVRKAYLDYIINDPDLKTYNEAQYKTQYEEDYVSEIYLFDISDNTKISGYDYIIRHDYTEDSYIYESFLVYDDYSKDFISSVDMDFHENLKTSRKPLEQEYPIIMMFDYDDWVENKERSYNAIKNINESMDIRKGLKTIPIDVRKAYMDFILNEKDYTNVMENITANNIHFVDGKFVDFISQLRLYDMSKNELYGNKTYKYIADKFKYIILLIVDYNDINSSGYSSYYGYDPKDKLFNDILDYDHLHDIHDDLEEIFNADEWDTFDLIEVFTEEDWLKNQNQSVGALKNINESTHR